ncbi:MAG: hypothetical protein OXM57_05695 [bacterium]|nr:hypothetical protein [bacterium]MDE0352163.1 hypothetical protein [bacterium]
MSRESLRQVEAKVKAGDDRKVAMLYVAIDCAAAGGDRLRRAEVDTEWAQRYLKEAERQLRDALDLVSRLCR